MPRWPRARSTPAVRGVSVVYSIRGSEGNKTRSRSISCDRACPDKSGSTTASSTGRPRMLVSTSSQVETCATLRSEEHTSELQSRLHLVCRLLLEKKKATHQ